MSALLLDYLPLVVFIAVALAIGLVLLIVPFIVAYKAPDPEKLSAYECGFNAFDDARMKFDVRFYLVAILFIIFDLELSFLFPCAIRSDHLGAHRLADVDDVRARLLCGRDDADVDAALRRGALRLRPARLAATIGCDDRGRDAHQQDGAGATQGLRPDAGAPLRHFHG